MAGRIEGLAEEVDSFAEVAAGFAFSMLGFLAAMMTLFSVLGETQAFKAYRRNGYLTVLLAGVAIAMVELAVAFVASLQLFMGDPTVGQVKCVLVLLGLSGGMTFFCVMPIVGMQVAAAREPT